jgi:hypothetical protein
MQRQQHPYMLLVSLVLLVAGCVPARYVEVPALRGRVIDADGRPIRDATVNVASDAGRNIVATMMSRIDGTFTRAEQSEFFLQFAGADHASRTYSVTASAAGRSSPATQVRSGIRRWFLWFYDPPTDRDVGDLVVR